MDFSGVFSKATLTLLFKGLGTTVGISLLAIAVGLIIGILTCFMGRSRNIIPRGIAAVYVWCIRGTPMLVQAFLVFFALPQLVQIAKPGFTITPYTAGFVTLALNAGAYMSEIFRGGIDAVSVGQIEASRSLGVSQTKTMIKIVLPQAFKISIPSLVNQFIITIKDSSILQAIGLSEVVNQAKQHVGKSYDFFPTYITVAALYLIVISALMVASKFIEKKLNYDKKG